jgi:integrase
VILVATLGLIPVLVIEIETNSSAWREFAFVVNWAIWLIFVAEMVFILRVAPRKAAALRAHWLDLTIIAVTVSTGESLAWRMAIGRACRDAGVPRFSPHALRHRRISLLHQEGVSWAEISDRVGQRSRIVTADRYTHALVDYGELDRSKLLGRVRAVQTLVQTSDAKRGSFAVAF